MDRTIVIWLRIWPVSQLTQNNYEDTRNIDMVKTGYIQCVRRRCPTCCDVDVAVYAYRTLVSRHGLGSGGEKTFQSRHQTNDLHPYNGTPLNFFVFHRWIQKMRGVLSSLLTRVSDRKVVSNEKN